ncbi:phage major tail tube protein [Helicobacter bizzozeronii]|uniref:phage major tail tube protein n=1 Tax=Helicobacter bizzozeronii TaxID=56877 RepID=UPI000CED91BA|nr:phage major tail tube protein [Helicobacter bizzozeronii]
MERIEPQAFTGGNVFIDGNGYSGLLKDFEPPKIEFETLEANASIGKYERALPIVKPLSSKITFQAIDSQIFSVLSKTQVTKIVIKNNVSGAEDDGSPKEIQIEATMEGSIKSCELPKAEMGKEVEISLEMSVVTLSYKVDKEEVISYDKANSVLKIDGDDQFQDIKNNIT